MAEHQESFKRTRSTSTKEILDWQDQMRSKLVDPVFTTVDDTLKGADHILYTASGTLKDPPH